MLFVGAYLPTYLPTYLDLPLPTPTYLPTYLPSYLPLSTTYLLRANSIKFKRVLCNKMNMFAQTWSIIDTHTYTHRLFC